MKKFHWTLFVLFLVAAAFIAAPTLNRILAGMQAEASLAEDVVAQETAVSQTTASSDEEFMDITIVGKNGQEHKDLSAYNRIGTIYIGDSRTVGMDDVLDLENIEEDTFVVAKVGQGYAWLTSTGLPQVERIKKQNPQIDAWQYIINLGVNDLGSIDKYLDKYKKLAEDDNVEILLVSVNPVKNYSTVSNDDIEEFNEELEDSGFYYIDTYSVLMKDGYSTTDGLHYTNDTYEQIHDAISSLR